MSTLDPPPNPSAFNKDAKYSASPDYHTKSIQFNVLEIAVTNSLSFQCKLPDLMAHYLNPNITDDKTIRMWNSQPLKCFQNQINFAVLCATTGCGVSFIDHMSHSDLLIRAVYRFRFYYQVRRILNNVAVVKLET